MKDDSLLPPHLVIRTSNSNNLEIPSMSRNSTGASDDESYCSDSLDISFSDEIDTPTMCKSNQFGEDMLDVNDFVFYL